MRSNKAIALIAGLAALASLSPAIAASHRSDAVKPDTRVNVRTMGKHKRIEAGARASLYGHPNYFDCSQSKYRKRMRQNPARFGSKKHKNR